jgi:heme-degrading monooxygenase HmoA
MILEQAILNVRKNQGEEFELAFSNASAIISSMKGYVRHQLLKCIENPNQYLLLVEWETLEDHTVGFRQSTQYQDWKKLLHHFYDPFPVVEHYSLVNNE